MVRPLSLDDIVAAGASDDTTESRPKFLSKSKREKLKLLKAQDAKTKSGPKLTRVGKAGHGPTALADTKKVTDSKIGKAFIGDQNAKSRGKSFKFSWGVEEDTLDDYQPLVTYNKVSDADDMMGLDDKHWSEKELGQMTSRDWRIFKEDYNIVTKGTDIADPLRCWEESKMPSEILHILMKKLHYLEPTPIQRAAIPLCLSQRDAVGVAETGSGKTLAFLLPLLTYISSIDKNYMLWEHQKESNLNKPLALVLAPTRELALQITNEADKFCKLLKLNVITIIGGHQYEKTIMSVQDGVHIVVATPGRLVDSLERGIVNLSKCYFFAMDEADRMIDMGFEKSLEAILSYLAPSKNLQHRSESSIFNVKKRTTLMFTATLSPIIEKITNRYLMDPGFIFIGGAGESVDRIDQQFRYMTSSDKAEIELDNLRVDNLLKILNQHKRVNPDYLLIIFANFKKVCESLSQELEDKGIKNIVIHGSKSQDTREKAIESFRAKRERVLIATDVAARGIDIPNVSLVINYQMPRKFDEYIHRIGRTGRAGNSGASFSIVDDSDSPILPDLKKYLVKGGKKCPEWLLRHPALQTQLLKD